MSGFEFAKQVVEGFLAKIHRCGEGNNHEDYPQHEYFSFPRVAVVPKMETI